MTTRTKGPWFVVWEEAGDDDSGGYGEYFASEIVSGAPDSFDTVDLLSKGNATLVASAPDMLAALRLVSAALEESMGDIAPPSLVQAVHAAIAKATEDPYSPLPHDDK